MASFTDTFGGTVISPAQPSYAAYTSSSSLSLSWPMETAPSNNIVAAINDISMTAGSLTVTLADATNQSVGIAPLFNNVGANQFSVIGATGGTILTATTGAAWVAYLASNATAGGTWRTFQMGAGTSSASAASLAGLGIKAITTTLNQEYPTGFSFSTTPQTLLTTHRAALVIWTGGAGVFNFTALATLTAGWFVNITNQGTGALVLTPPSGLIDNAATKTLNPGDTVIAITDGTNMYTIGFGQSAVFGFTFLIIDLTGLSGTYTISGLQLNKTALRFTGAIAGAIDIIVPSTVQQYWVDNETTGGFTFGVRTVTQASPGVAIAATARDILYCDGTNVVRAETVGFATPVPIGSGGTGATTATGAQASLNVPSTIDAFSYVHMFR